MDEIKNLLNEEIKTEIEELSSLQAGSDAKSKAVNDLQKLYQLRIDEIKAENTRQEQTERHELERDRYFLESQTRDDERVLKEAQHKSQNLDRWISFGLAAGQVLVTIIAYDIWNRRGLKFEETGTVNSPHTRNLLSKMLPGLRK